MTKISHPRDSFDAIRCGNALASVLQQDMPDSALKDKKVIDPTEEKKEPEARDTHTNWKNTTYAFT